MGDSNVENPRRFTFAILVAATTPEAGTRLAQALGELGARVSVAQLSWRLADVLGARWLHYRVIPQERLVDLTSTAATEFTQAAVASTAQPIELPVEWPTTAPLVLDVWMTPTPTMGVLRVTVDARLADD
jgi:hypothetical protein